MNSLQQLSDDQLLEHSQTIAASERKIYTQIIETLEEIERRKLYLARGYSSLFSFCTEFLKYSPSAAQRRIESMRLVKNFTRSNKEMVKEKIQTGAVNLTHLSQVAQAVRSMKERPSNHEKMKLIETVENTTSSQCAQKLYEAGATEIFKKETLKKINEEESRLSLSLDEETLGLLKRFQELTAHKNPEARYALAIKEALELAVKTLEKARMPKAKDHESVEVAEALKSTKSIKNSPALETTENITTATESLGVPFSVETTASEPRMRTIPAALKRMVWVRDHGKCQYEDPQTKRICHSRYGLQFDHIREFSRGGEHSEENLRLFCAAHNRHRQAYEHKSSSGFRGAR